MIHSTSQDYLKYRNQIQMASYIGFLVRSPRIHPFFHTIIVILVCLIQITVCCGVVNFFLANAKDISAVANGLGPICTTLTTVVKVGRFALKRKDVKELDNTLKELFNTELKRDSRQPILLSLLSLFRRIFHFYVMLYAGAGLAYNTPPLISMIYQNVYHIYPKKYQLTIPLKFPWDIGESGLRYQLHYLLQLCTCLPLYCINVAAEVLFVFYVFHMAGVFRTMAYRLENPEKDESRISLLRSCAKKHKLVLRCHNIIQDVYGPIIVNIVLSNGIAMCSLIFQAFQTQVTVKKACIQVTYFFVKFVQILIYSWSANVMTVESEKFANGVYFSDWVGKSVEMKTDLIIMMIQRPLIVNASGFCNVSMVLIPKIINTTLSYYFLLKTLNEI